MMQFHDIADMFDCYKCCVIIPTYNNASTLGKVIDDVLRYTDRVIVVNDGSTDNTADVLSRYESLCMIIHQKKNRGKGFALRTAFRYARARGFRYAVTIDSDGQHLASDLPAFMRKLAEEPNAIIIGARDMNQDGIPKKSSFGNAFSNFWFHFETGKKLTDTQSGYRLYPLDHVGVKRYFTSKYEFEIEVIVRATWNGIGVAQVPIRVIYHDDEERVSHFRPFKDFSRISVLNTVLVAWTLLYVKPRNFLRALTWVNIKSFVYRHILVQDEPIAKVVMSVAFGLFMGIAPIWGYQMIIAIALATVFRLNKAIVLVAANISIPPFIPIIIYGSYYVGSFLVSDIYKKQVSFDMMLNISAVKQNLMQYVVGSLALGVITALVGALATYICIKLVRAAGER
jgi:glycosyltransferase involved in cell wall biosynthesis